MTALARSNANPRHYRCSRKKRKMKKKTQLPANQNTKNPGTMSVLLTLLCLIGIFTILAYFRPH